MNKMRSIIVQHVYTIFVAYNYLIRFSIYVFEIVYVCYVSIVCENPTKMFLFFVVVAQCVYPVDNGMRK